MMINDSNFTNGGWRSSPEYAQAVEHLEQGRWEEASALLTQMVSSFPGESALQALLTEAQLRQETERMHNVRAKRLVLPDRRVIFALVLVVVLAGLSFLALTFYRDMIVPSMVAAQGAKEEEAVASQAQQALAAGDYERALELYLQLATLNPEHPAAQEGISQAKLSIETETLYNQALQQLADDQISEAQATLTRIQEIAPTYRNVNTLLEQIERRQRLAGLLRQASDAQDNANWEEAVLRLEEARSICPQEDIDSISANLFDVYLAYAGKIVDESEGQPADLTRAVEVYSKALSLQPQESRATTRRQWARQYLAGYAAFTDGKWSEAIAQLEPLYAAQPGYVGGKATQLLYDAYVHSAEQLIKEEQPELAWERYFRASQLKGVDTTGARALADKLSTEMTPTPTPTATPTATRVPTRAPQARSGGGTRATPVPANAPLSRYQGKIAYYSNRGGAKELWVMDPDGKNPIRLEDQARAREEYQRLHEAELRSPDGRGTLTVRQPEGASSTQIFVNYSDGTSVQLTYYGGVNYDPVWSPTGHWIAFVSSTLGNDEIFITGANGENMKRLTLNDWEWDKHPSWSPDGSQLVFWSNRETGHPQIWRMKQDGGEQINISNNDYEEQDPLWIK